MPSHNFLNFFLSNILSQFRHSVSDIIHSNFIISINIELLEKRIKFRGSEELLNGDSGSKEFHIVDFLVAIIVEFGDDLLDLVRTHFVFGVFERLFKLIQLDESRVVSIDFLKFLSEFLDVLIGQHLHEHVKCCLLEFAAPLEFLQLLDDFLVTLQSFLLLYALVKPRVLETLLAGDALRTVHGQHALDQVEAFRRGLLRYVHWKLKVAFHYLIEHFCTGVAIEGIVTCY